MQYTAQSIMKRIILFLISLCMLLCFASCRRAKEPISTSSETDASTEGIPSEITEAVSDAIQIAETSTPDNNWQDPSLVVFRQTMVETPQLFAAAYFGNVPQGADPFVVMLEAAPQLCKDLPFLLTIHRSHVLGTAGQLFCIVPADENTTVAVNRRPWNPETESYEEPEVLYRSESGSPVLVMCPNDNWIPDTEITFTDPGGTVTVWSPFLDPDYRLSSLRNDKGESLIFDFTSYDELPDPCQSQEIDSNELVGTWELTWTEVEGDRNEAAPGRCTIEITLDEAGCFRFTYSDRDFPEENIRDRELTVVPGELYPGCGNNQWIAEVTEESGDAVQYALTLLADSSLLVQTYWEMEGMSWISYGWYMQAG